MYFFTSHYEDLWFVQSHLLPAMYDSSGTLSIKQREHVRHLKNRIRLKELGKGMLWPSKMPSEDSLCIATLWFCCLEMNKPTLIETVVSLDRQRILGWVETNKSKSFLKKDDVISTVIMMKQFNPFRKCKCDWHMASSSCVIYWDTIYSVWLIFVQLSGHVNSYELDKQGHMMQKQTYLVDHDGFLV